MRCFIEFIAGHDFCVLKTGRIEQFADFDAQLGKIA
jgi:hypothetical protein